MSVRKISRQLSLGRRYGIGTDIVPGETEIRDEEITNKEDYLRKGSSSPLKAASVVPQTRLKRFHLLLFEDGKTRVRGEPLF